MQALRQLALASGVTLMLAACASAWAAEAVPRSAAVKAEFRRSNPCPSTGSTRGACPGWQVDHREALVCGGRDEVGNMQWLSVEEHKAKTRVEVKLCRSHVAAQPPASAGER